jgi:hypothetical protein
MKKRERDNANAVCTLVLGDFRAKNTIVRHIQKQLIVRYTTFFGNRQCIFAS